MTPPGKKIAKFSAPHLPPIPLTSESLARVRKKIERRDASGEENSSQ
nr:MAG TPA: hypothetical protein [Caudoviricetes sp.]